MLGKIIGILDNTITLKLGINVDEQVNLINLHVVLEDSGIKIVGEISDIDQTEAKITIVGEIIDNYFLPGFSKKPSFKSTCRLVNAEELKLILGDQETKLGEVYFGLSTVYKNYKINVNVNNFFSNHFAILGNTGSGKSFTVSRLLQNVFFHSAAVPVNANVFIFDAYGEYTNAFSRMSEVSPYLHYKNYTTNTNKYVSDEVLRIPLWLLGVDDIAQLLGVTTPEQLPIIEKALKLVTVLRGDNPDVIRHKNDIIARALVDILMSGREAAVIRDQMTAILSNFNTAELNLDTQIVQPGYIRSLKQLIYVDKTGKIQEMEIVVDFIKQFIVDGLELKNPDGTIPYTLKDLENAMDFALISEGVLQSNAVFDYANVLSVRLHALASGTAAEYFSYPTMINREEYIKKLLTASDGGKVQIVNFNINYIDDRLAKAITKIMSKFLFDYATETKERAAMPFHIIIEEAHRYVQRDKDEEILGYNIFDRITKEGRKYGVLLGLITQRPSELSDTSISQCSNFVILRTLHPKDLEYIRNMVPNISSSIVEQLKTLQPGNCMAFGNAFKIPVAMRIERPNPEPFSNSANIEKVWYNLGNAFENQQVGPVTNTVVRPVSQVANQMDKINAQVVEVKEDPLEKTKVPELVDINEVDTIS